MVGPKKRKGQKSTSNLRIRSGGKRGSMTQLFQMIFKKPMQVWIHLKWMSNLPIVPLNFLLENISVLDFQWRIFPVESSFRLLLKKKSSVFLACDPGWLKKANQEKPTNGGSPNETRHTATIPLTNPSGKWAAAHGPASSSCIDGTESRGGASFTSQSHREHHGVVSYWEYGCFQK